MEATAAKACKHSNRRACDLSNHRSTKKNAASIIPYRREAKIYLHDMKTQPKRPALAQSSVFGHENRTPK